MLILFYILLGFAAYFCIGYGFIFCAIRAAVKRKRQLDKCCANEPDKYAWLYMERVRWLGVFSYKFEDAKTNFLNENMFIPILFLWPAIVAISMCGSAKHLLENLYKITVDSVDEDEIHISIDD